MGLHVQTEILNSGNINASATVSGVNLIASSLSAGGIVYPTSAGLLTQSTSQLYWNSSTNRLGIGIGSTPGGKVQIDTDAGENNVALLITHDDTTHNKAMVHGINATSGYDLRLENSYAGGTSGIGTKFYSFATYNPSGASSGLLSTFSFAGYTLNGNVSGNPVTFASVQAWALDNSSGSPDGGLFFRTKVNDTDILMMTLKNTVESRDHNPFSDLTYDLGTSSKRWNVGYFGTLVVPALSGVTTINGSSILTGNVADKRILFGSGSYVQNVSNLVYDYSTGRVAITGISGQTADFFQVSDFSSNELFSVGASDIVINEGGQARDFRIESDTYSNFFGLDGTNDHLVIGQTTSISALQIPGKTNVLTVAGSMSTGGVSRLRSPSSSASLQFGTRDSKYVTTSWPGRLMNRNPDFMMTAVGTSGLSITGFSRYGASFNTLAVLQDNTAPNKSAKIMRCIYPGSGSGSTGIGGFHCGENPLSVAPDDAAVSSWSKYRKGSRFATIIWAKIPSGRSIQRGSNAIGTSGNQNWMTSQAGTDNWEKYVLLTTIGESGTFSTTNFFYVDGDTSTDAYWDVASCHTVALDEDAASVDFGQLNVGLKENMVIGWGELVTTSTSYLAIDGGSLRVGTTGNPGSFLANFAGNVGPNADATYSLGSNSFQWLSVYANSGSFPALVNVTGINGIAPSSFLNTFNGSIGLNQIAYGAGSNIFGGNANFLYTSGIRQLMMSGTTSASIPNIALHGSGDMLLLNTTTNQDSGSYVRFTEGTTYQGAYLNYDAAANLFFIGVHETANSVKSSDIEAITIRRSNGTVGINTVATSRLHVFENSSNVDSSAGLTIEQSGAGDAVVQFLLSGSQRWVAGIDNSDNDRFKISWDADLADNTPFVITTSGTISLGGGTTTPSAYVHILPTGTTTLANGDIPALRIQRAGTSNRLDFYNDAAANWIVSDDIGSNHKHLINLIVCSGSDLNRNFYVYFADNATKTVTQTERMTVRGSGVGGINLASAAPQAAWEVVSPHTAIPTILARGIAAQTASLIEARNSSANDLFHVRLSEVVINDGSVDLDTRIETNNDDNMLFIDGGNDWAIFGSASNPGSFKLAVGGFFGPTAHMAYDVGSLSYRFKTIYASGLDLSGQLKLGDQNGVLKAFDGVVQGGATTSDVPEGYNLYFTNQRAIDAVASSGSFTPGSIIFAGTSGQLDEDAGQLHYDATSRLVGIRTNQPTAHIHVQHTNARIRLENNGSATAALSGVMFSGSPGLHLSAAGQNNSTNPYSPGIIFESTDPQLTTLNPKGLAGIVGRATETYNADTTGGMALDFIVTGNSFGTQSGYFVAMTINQNGWVGIGSGTTTPSAGLHVKPLGATDGTEIIRMDGERSWSFIQRGTAGSAAMHLTDNTGGKTFSVDTTGPLMKRNNTTGSDTITFINTGTNGRTAIGPTAQTAAFTPGSTLVVYGEAAVNVAHFNADNANSNFRYDSQHLDNYLLIDADTDAIGFGAGGVSATYAYYFVQSANAPTHIMDIRDSGLNPLLTIAATVTSLNLGQQDRDFTVWGSGARYMIHADCGTQAVTVGGGTSTSYLLNVQPTTIGSVPADYFGVRDSAASELFSVGASDVIINEGGADRDFRIESDTLSNNFTIDGASGTIGINVSVSQPGQILRTASNYVDTVGNGTNFYRNINNFGITCNIASGVTDAGYRVGMWNDFYFNNSGFVGTLNEQYGMYLGVGTNTTAPSGTINTIYGLFLAVNSGVNAIHGTEWGIYQTATSNSSQNYFKGDVRIGTASNAGNFKVNVAGDVGPQTDSTYSLGSNALRWLSIYSDSGVIPALLGVTGINSTGISSFLNVLTAGAIQQHQVMFGSGNQTFGGTNNFTYNNSIQQLMLSGTTSTTIPNVALYGSGDMLLLNMAANQASGSYVRWTEGTQYQGAYLNYDAVNNYFHIGVHETANSLISSDVDAITIRRSNATVGFGVTPASKVHIYESTTNVDSSAGLTIEQGSTGDSVVQFLLTGAQRWVMGIDNSDSDKFKLSRSADLASNAFMVVTTDDKMALGGSLTAPLAAVHIKPTGATTPGGTGILRLQRGAAGGNFIEFFADGNNNYVVSDDTATNHKSLCELIISSGSNLNLSYNVLFASAADRGTVGNYVNRLQVRGSGGIGIGLAGAAPDAAIQVTNFSAEKHTIHARGISAQTGDHILVENSSSQELFSVGASDLVINEAGLDRDFRVEGDTDTHLLFCNAGTDTISIGTSSNAGSFLLNVDGHVGPQVSGAYDLGSLTLPWRDLYLSSGTVYLGNNISIYAPLNRDMEIMASGGRSAFYYSHTSDAIGLGTRTPTTFRIEFSGHFGPTANTTYDIGSAARLIRKVWAATGSIPALVDVTGINGTPIADYLSGGAGTIGGTLAASQVGYGSATDTLAGNNNFRYISAINQLMISGGTGTAGIIPNLAIGGSGNMFVLTTPADNTSGAYMRITEAATFIGGYMSYDCVNNRFQLGTHTNNNNLTSSDLPAITIARNTANIGIGANGLSPNYQLSLGSNLNNTKLALYDDGVSPYGIGIQSSQMRFHTAGDNNRFSFYNSPAGTERFTISSTGLIGINQPTPTAAVHIVPTGTTCTGLLMVGVASQSADFFLLRDSSANELWSIGTTDVVYNEAGLDRDFRIESDTGVNAFVVDAGLDRIGFGTAGMDTFIHIDNGTSDTFVTLEKDDTTQCGLRFDNAGTVRANITFNSSEDLVIENTNNRNINLLTAGTGRVQVSGHPVGSYCQLRNDAITGINPVSATLMNAWVTDEDINTNQSLFVASTSGIQVTQAGKYKCHLSIYATGSAGSENVSIAIRWNKMGPTSTAQSGVCVMTMPANSPNGQDEMSASMTKIITCNANDFIGITYQRVAGTGNINMPSGDSFLILERILG